VGRKEGWAGGLLGALREKEEERRWAALGWERREVWYFFQILFQTFKSLNSSKLFQLLNSFPKFSNFTQTNNKTMHSNHDAQALIASKLLKLYLNIFKAKFI
jgi:hypothetical protein